MKADGAGSAPGWGDSRGHQLARNHCIAQLLDWRASGIALERAGARSGDRRRTHDCRVDRRRARRRRRRAGARHDGDCFVHGGRLHRQARCVCARRCGARRHRGDGPDEACLVATLFLVFAGLDPAIHPLRKKRHAKVMHPRVIRVFTPVFAGYARGRRCEYLSTQVMTGCPWPSWPVPMPVGTRRLGSTALGGKRTEPVVSRG
jgi:hypothetical protein